MPVVLLLDCSLSMGRAPTPGAEVSYLWLAVHAARRFLEHLRSRQPLESVLTLLVGYSGANACQVLRPAAAGGAPAAPPPDEASSSADWTRDHAALSAELQCLLDGGGASSADALRGRADLQLALETAHRAVLHEWGALQTCDLLFFTDEGGAESVPHQWHAAARSWQPRAPKELPLPLAYPGTFVLLALAAENLVCAYYRDAVARAGSTRGVLLALPAAPSSCQPVDQLVKTQLCEALFAPHLSTLRLGALTCRVQVFPAPREFVRVRDLETVRYQVAREIAVVGFLAVAHVYSPATVSRHVLSPVPSACVDAADQEERTTPNLSVLLHGALRLEPMVAVVTLGRDWWGLLHSSAAGAGGGGGSGVAARRCLLALSILEPGSRSVPWLGGLQFLAPYSDFDSVDTAPFPLKLRDEERSFSAAQPCWTRASALTADVNKLVRFARKLPDKAPVFYKDYNRVRRYALAFGMQAVLEKLRVLLEREYRATSSAAVAAPSAAHRALRDKHLARVISHLQEPHWSIELAPIGQGGVEPPPLLEPLLEPALAPSSPPPADAVAASDATDMNSDQPIDLTK